MTVATTLRIPQGTTWAVAFPVLTEGFDKTGGGSVMLAGAARADWGPPVFDLLPKADVGVVLLPDARFSSAVELPPSVLIGAPVQLS